LKWENLAGGKYEEKENSQIEGNDWCIPIIPIIPSSPSSPSIFQSNFLQTPKTFLISPSTTKKRQK
jgi:hypothetical protein